MSDVLEPVGEEHFRALERERTRALVARDMQTIERLHAPGYQLVTPSGAVFTRERYLAKLAEGPFYASWEAEGPIDVRVSARMAVVRYRARLGFPSGKVVECWHIDTYELRDGGQWQAVWSQATGLATSGG